MPPGQGVMPDHRVPRASRVSVVISGHKGTPAVKALRATWVPRDLPDPPGLRGLPGHREMWVPRAPGASQVLPVLPDLLAPWVPRV